MVPDITRRTLLAGSGTAIGAGLLGTGLLAPTWLPDPVTDRLLTVYPDPPDHLWRPEITAEHADEAVALLEATVQRANARKDRVDVDSLDEDLAFHLDGGRDPSGGWLESAKEESDPWKRLSAATSGMLFAGEIIGYATVALDEVDTAALVERGDQLRSSADDVHESLGEYPVSDPARDLAFIYFVERELSIARLNVPQLETDKERNGETEQYSAYQIASAWGSHVRAEQRIRNARYYRDLYRDNLGVDARQYADALTDALTTLADAVDEFPSRAEMRTRVREELELTQETPYGAARWELLTLCYDNDFRSGFDEDGYRPGHTVQRVVETAQAVLARRAHEFALSELDVSPDDTGYDSGRAFREKRRAVRTFRSVRDDQDSPFAGVLAQEAAERIRAGEVNVKSTWHPADDRPAWRDHVEATTYYLVGTGQLGEFDDVFGTILDGV